MRDSGRDVGGHAACEMSRSGQESDKERPGRNMTFKSRQLNRSPFSAGCLVTMATKGVSSGSSASFTFFLPATVYLLKENKRQEDGQMD